MTCRIASLPGLLVLLLECFLQATSLQVTESLWHPHLMLDQSRAGAEHEPYRQEMHNFMGSDVQYTADISIGSQTVNGVLDTGSFELLVFAPSCEDCGETSELYRHGKSETYTRGNLIALHSFGSGDVNSIEGFERISVGPLIAENMSFWEVFEADMPVLKESGIQAIIGVGPPGEPQLEANAVAQEDRALASIANATVGEIPYLESQANESAENVEYVALKHDSLVKELNVNRFSVCFGQRSRSPGYFIWHDRDPMSRSGAVSLSVVGEFSWGVKMDSANLVGGALNKDVAVGCEDGCGALVDSGTSLLLMPRAAAEKLVEAISGMHPEPDCSSFDSNTLPTLQFNLDGQPMQLPPEAYLGRFLGIDPLGSLLAGRVKVVCDLELLVMTEDSETQFGPLWILGMPFMREYYTTFDLGNVGDSGAPKKIHVVKNDGTCMADEAASGSAGGQEDLSLASPGSASGDSPRRSFLNANISQLRVSPAVVDRIRRRRRTSVPNSTVDHLQM